jgi:tRNA nucleotidyltransferase (CCA-adding enzyme)
MPSVNINALENDLLLRGVWEGLGTPECHVTGGYVRDRLLSKKSVDLDLVLPGSLEEATGPARRLAARLDTRAHLLGRDANQVWRIETPDIRIELWSRGELSLDQDINRRDFSLNTLVWKLPDGPLEDRAGGVPDLKSGIIRALSIQNLADDPVRLVRAPRFLAQLEGFRIDRETDRWIRDLAPGLFNAPRERVGLELLKLTGAQGAAVGIRSLITLGLFESSAPDDARCDPVWTERNLTALDRLTGSVPHPVTAAVRESGFTASLAFLLRGWGSFTAKAIAAYAWPRTTRQHAARAAGLLDHAVETVKSSAADRRWFIYTAESVFPAAIAFAAAVEPDQPWTRWWRMWRDRGPELMYPEPLLSGHEIADILGLDHGPQLGRLVEALTEAQVKGEVKSVGGARRWLESTLQP